MLSTSEKVLLLDEVTNTARSAWQIIIIGDNNFQDCQLDGSVEQAFLGYHTLKNLLSVTLMTACYSLVETGNRSYSFHHAKSDTSLKVSTKTKIHFEKCFENRGKIATYRNNVVAHVNSKRTQFDWANMADIKHQDIDSFLDNAKSAVTELAGDNYVSTHALGINKPVRDYFREYCRVTANIDFERKLKERQTR